MSSKWHIVYPCGDRKRLSVVEICAGLEYELSDYAVASRESFDDPESADGYAAELAKKHGLEFRSSSSPDYLD